jgi:nitrate/nitrite-specific signal transduction histidine kinase
LSISDDGCELSAPATRSGGMGLRIMQYRAKLIGAVLAIGAAKGTGITIVCALSNSREKN